VSEAVDVQSITGAHGGETRLAAYSRQSKNLGKNQEILERFHPQSATGPLKDMRLSEKFALQLFT